MSKYTFICEEESTPYSIVVESKKTVEFRADGLDDILQEFESFLRGSGFHFDGYLDIVKDDYESEEDVNYIFEHQSDSKKFDFSSIPKNNWPFNELMPESACDSEIEVDNDIVINLGAAQPAMHYAIDESENVFNISLDGLEEKCSVCKLPKSVMKAEKCYDNQCPKTSWLNDLDYKLASEK